MTGEPSHTPDQAKHVPLPPPGPLPGMPAKVVDSNDLMDGNSEILISHKGAVYRLRETRSGKLILQK